MKFMNEKETLKLFVTAGIITKDLFKEIFRQHRDTGKVVTRLLLDKELVTVNQINTTLAAAGNSDLDSYIPDTDLLDKFREEQVRKHHVMPLFISGTKIYVAMVDPTNIDAQQMVGFASGFTQLRNIEASPEDVKRLIDTYYGRRSAILDAIKEVSSMKKQEKVEDRRFSISAVAQSDVPVVKLVDEYIQRALEEDASDIHFEPHEDRLSIRMRIDGHLQTIETIPASLVGPVTSRVKIMSQMKIDIRMIPQDGRFSRIVNDVEMDFRVSSFPGIFGESIVLRLLKRRMRVLLDDLGLAPSMLKRFRESLEADRGIFLVTGPTGCGKTTTLVSILSEVRNPKKKIVTLENPVEYQIDGAVQGQVHPQAGFTWAKGLRSILRHDPNIIMVAEIRDTETASIAIEAGLTGHFVLSTLHTNNAPGTIVRLLEMGVEPYLVSSSLIAVLAQRLVRVICPDCKKPYTPPPQLLKAVGLKDIPKTITLYRGEGCKTCRHTGFKGRTGIFELMLVTEKMRQMILDGAMTSQIEIEARKNGMQTLRQDGIRKALQGLTTLEEIISVTHEKSLEE